MLEPLTAISIASAVVQFIDFGSKVVTRSSEIYRSSDGALQENTELENIIREVTKLNEKVLSSRPNPHTDGFSKDDEATRELVGSCEILANDLLQVLRDLKAQHSGPVGRRWTCLRKAVASQTPWNKDKVQGLERRLNRVKEQIGHRLLVMMSEDQFKIKLLLEHLANEQLYQLQKGIVCAVQTSGNTITNRRLTEISDKLSLFAEKAKEQAVFDAINSLDVGNIKKRGSAISESHLATFHWIFDDAHALRGLHNFRAWLQSDSNMYWISGKPGSGKSTLMKYVVDNARTQQYLQFWAGKETIITASHYLWIAGDTLQNSVQGLLQSLLYDVFRQCPVLMSIVCPSRTTQFQKGTKQWTRRELLDAFRRLKSDTTDGKFCFFIDGLDELKGDHMDIIRILKDIASGSRIKICFSSRPWSVFTNAYPATPGLILEDHTRPDIETYVNGILRQDECYLSLSKTDERYHRLPTIVIDDAKGVFLWVKLVIGDLLRGIWNGDDFVDLQKRVQCLPRSLDEYYESALDRIDEFYKEETARMLLLISAAKKPLSMATVTFYNLSRSATNPAIYENSLYSKTNYDAAYEASSKRLQSRCQDIVAIGCPSKRSNARPRHTIDFIHGTVADFLSTPRMQAKLIESSGQGFEPRLCLLEATLAEIKSVPGLVDHTTWKPTRRHRQRKRLAKLIEHFMDYVSELEAEEKGSYDSFLKEFDRVLQNHVNMMEPSCGHWSDSSYYDICRRGDIKIESSGNQASDLLAFSIQEDLQLFVARELNGNPGKARKSLQYPFLYYALGALDSDHGSERMNRRCYAKMIHLLLQFGATSNDSVSAENILNGLSLTISDLFLRALYYQNSSPTQDQLDIAVLLLESAGKSIFSSWHVPLGSSDYYPKRITLIGLTGSIFPRDQAAELEALIMKSTWYRFWRWWSEASLTGWTVVIYYFIVDTIRLEKTFIWCLYPDICATITPLTSHFRKSQDPVKHEDIGIGDWHKEWPFNFIIGLVITGHVLLVGICLLTMLLSWRTLVSILSHIVALYK